MRYTWALLLLLAFAPMEAQTAAKNKKVQKGKPAMDTITGCVDEKAMQYVLRTDDMLRELATLEPVGFEATNFARFVGHKVSISGQLKAAAADQTTPTLRVSSLDQVKNISDVCTPPGEAAPPK